MKGKSIINKTTFINSKITSTISISLVLFLLGLIILLSLITKKSADHIKENIPFIVDLPDSMKEIDINKLQKKIESFPFTKTTTYKSKEDVAEEIIGTDEDYFSLKKDNFFPASIIIKLNAVYVNKDSIEIIEEMFKEEYNAGVFYPKINMDVVNHKIKDIYLWLGLFAGLLLLISFVLINNTIRLMIYSKRFLIHTMKLIGASNSFIRKPFVHSNILTGIFAAIIAMGLLSALLYYCAKIVDIPLVKMISVDSLIIVFGIIMIFGILISITATCFAVNSYLRTKADDLYLI